MPSLTNWFTYTGKALNFAHLHDRAAGVAMMSNYREGVDVVLYRAGTALDSQRVVVAWIAGTTTTQSAGASGSTGNLDLMLTGPKDHPTLPDFNVARGDKFSLSLAVDNNTIRARYEVTFVDTALNGKIEAHCRSIQS